MVGTVSPRPLCLEKKKLFQTNDVEKQIDLSLVAQDWTQSEAQTIQRALNKPCLEAEEEEGGSVG